MTQKTDGIARIDQPLENNDRRLKKTYHAPILRDYGHVREVTLTDPSGGPLDSGGYPFTYTS